VRLLHPADECSVAIRGGLERPVVLGQSFVEPERKAAYGVVHEQVDVLVINDAEIVETILGGERDVVDCPAGEEESPNIADLALIRRLQRLVALVRLENDDRYRRLCRQDRFRQDDAEREPELFEPLGHLTQLTGTDVPEEQKIRRLKLQPSFAGTHLIACCSARRGRRAQANRRAEDDAGAGTHGQRF
jgi:hypothetical protein